MNKIKLFLSVIIIILIAVFVLFGIRSSIQYEQNTENHQTNIFSTTTSYYSESNQEAIVTYTSDNGALLTISNTEYQNIPFRIAVSASGARYENIEQHLVLWEKAPHLTISKNEILIFEGSLKQDVFQKNDVTSFVWKWIETTNKTEAIIPKNSNNFTLTFTPDGRVSGTTDCNNFSGTYIIEDTRIQFSSFLSTMMYCEGSQEEQFMNSIQSGMIIIEDTRFELSYNDIKVLFEKMK